MSIGIVSISGYIPRYRLQRDAIGKAWGNRALRGERSVANTDEDSLTMAVEASLACLRKAASPVVDALFFASVTAPYAEKSHASMVATVCNLDQAVFTGDFAHSPKAGTSALRAALDAVASGSSRMALATAADSPLAYPRSEQEQLCGDAGAAVLIGPGNVLAEYKGSFSVNTEILDSWRNYGEVFPHSAEGRFALDKGYNTATRAAITGMLRKAGLEASQIAKLVLATPDLRAGEQVARKLGFAPEQVQDSLMLRVGYCASAQPLLLLAGALETAKPGEYILVVSYGTGADALLFQATEQVVEAGKGMTLAKSLAAGKPLDSYVRYLSFRELVQAVPGEPFRTFPSTAAYWREAKSILKLYGSRCKQCGVTTTPIQRICPECTSKDDFEEVFLADRKAKVFTFSIDNLAGRSDDPTVVQTVCEDADGTRYYLLMTDFNAAEIEIGMDVNFSFRKIYVGGDYNNYYWKCRPVA